MLILPTAFNFLWMTVFGNSAIWLDQNEAAGQLSSLAGRADELLFRFLDYLPASGASSSLAIFIIFIFFVTSADSGIFVINSIASGNAEKSPKWQLIAWGMLLALLALVLLNAGGLQSLQTMTLITALPFAVVMILFCYSLVQALIVDNYYYNREFSPATNNWTGELWKDRLQKILSVKSLHYVDQYIESTVRPALGELAAELNEKGIQATLEIKTEPTDIALTIKHKEIEDFVYGVRNQDRTISNILVKEGNVPNVKKNEANIPVSYFGDNRLGYNM